MKQHFPLFQSLVGALLLTSFPVAECYAQDWRKVLQEQLPLMGHRNWIVIADAAYPWQSAPGIQTIAANESMPAVINNVLSILRQTPHVKAKIHTDAELPFVGEKQAPGIEEYRTTLNNTLKEQAVGSLPHEQIIAKLDAAGRQFRILVIKTPLNLPYTSLFIELDCGYWDSEAERILREAISRTSK